MNRLDKSSNQLLSEIRTRLYHLNKLIKRVDELFNKYTSERTGIVCEIYNSAYDKAIAFDGCVNLEGGKVSKYCPHYCVGNDCACKTCEFGTLKNLNYKFCSEVLLSVKDMVDYAVLLNRIVRLYQFKGGVLTDDLCCQLKNANYAVAQNQNKGVVCELALIKLLEVPFEKNTSVFLQKINFKIR